MRRPRVNTGPHRGQRIAKRKQASRRITDPHVDANVCKHLLAAVGQFAPSGQCGIEMRACDINVGIKQHHGFRLADSHVIKIAADANSEIADGVFVWLQAQSFVTLELRGPK